MNSVEGFERLVSLVAPRSCTELTGEDDGEPGCTIKGRLFAFGYVHGLRQQAAERMREP